MRVLVTGGGGFLGNAICRQLAAAGDAVVAFQRSPAPELERLGIQVTRGNIADRDVVAVAVGGCDAVVHTAGKAGIWGGAAEFMQVNVDGTANVIDACRRQGVGMLVHTSSPSVVHTGGDIRGTDESLPVAERFTAPYPASKAAAEKLVLAASDDRLRCTALRPHLVWGPGDPHFLPRLVHKARRGSLALPGPDKPVDTTYVDNAARAHVLALRELAGDARCAGKAYFVTNGEPRPQGEIIAGLLSAVGIEVTIRPVPVSIARAAGAVCEFAWRALRLPSEPPVTRFAVEQLATAHWFDITAARRDFGYRPTITIAEGLERLRAAHTGQPPL